jgi:hypothetical protein
MSRTAKWIIGILIGLLVVCTLASAGFIASRRMYGVATALGVRPPETWEGGRLNPRDTTPWDDMPMRRMMPFGFFRGFFPFRGLLVALMCLIIPLLVILGIVALVVALTRTNGRGEATTSTPALAATRAVEQEEAGTLTETCPNCGRMVNTEWSHCPYCGTTLKPSE